ncbi:DDE_3 domain-containing protein [Trichonephila clavipes]|nr:DDE_3 domain-containing protein [Trichonephila clavipes]
MDDNARTHRALLVDEFLENEDIPRMEWPVRSQDLNPIEHVWDNLMRAIAINIPFENHPGHKNSVPERMGRIVTITDKVPYFKHDITL